MYRISVALLLINAVSDCGLAQSGSQDTQTIENLRREIAVMSQRLRDMEKTLSALEAKSSERDAHELDIPAVTSPKGVEISDRVAKYETANEDQAPAPRTDNLPLDPTYAGFFRLPTTKTWLQIGGYVKTDFLYDLKPAGNTDAFVPSSIPVGPGADVQNANFHARQSRFNFDFRTPLAGGNARTFLEFDFFGSNGPTTPRLRHLYGQFRNILVGLTYSNFTDPDALPDTLDFAGPNGGVKTRNVQLRYSAVLTKRSTIRVSVEKPVSDVLSRRVDIAIDPSSPAPDLSASWRYEVDRGHLQVSSIYRWIAATANESRTASVFGWGVGATSGFRTFDRDNVVLEFTFGRGIGRYIDDTSGQGVDAALESIQNPVPKALPAIGISAAYQHYWARQLRSTATFGYASVENTSFQADNFFHRSQYFAGNVIWAPMRQFQLGAEALYGWQELKGGARGNATRIQFSTKYRFLTRDE